MRTIGIVMQSEKSFEEGAINFLRDIEKGNGFRELNRGIGHSRTLLQVGIGEHTGLVFKNGYVAHAQAANRYYHKLVNYFKARGYEPGSYGLAEPKFVAVGEHLGVIQEYFDEPSLSELGNYLVMIKQKGVREKKLSRDLNAAEINGMGEKFGLKSESKLRCEQLLKRQQNADITLEQMIEVEREFKEDWEYFNMWIKPENVIVLGKRETEPDKIGLAIIDY